LKSLDPIISCAGNWSGRKSLRDPDRIAPQESPSTVAISTILNGRFVRLDYTWEYQGCPQQGSLLIGHDPGTEVATAHWVDTWHMGFQVMASRGSIGGDGEISLRGSYAAPPGPDWGWRTIISPGEGQRLRITMFNISPEGREELAVEASYSRELETSRLP